MKRREVVALLVGGFVEWPLATHGQQPPAMPTVGFLSGRSPSEAGYAVAALRQGLGETGYVEGNNVKIEDRWADGHYDRLPALAAELVGRGVNVIAATGGSVAGLAAKSVTATIPVVFTSGSDPVQIGLVDSLNRPGGNVTGVSFLFADLGAKRLDLLRELLPRAAVIGLLVNPTCPSALPETRDVQASAKHTGWRSVSSTPVPKVTSSRPLQRSLRKRWTRFWLGRTHSCKADAISSCGWRPVMRFQHCTMYAISSWRVA